MFSSLISYSRLFLILILTSLFLLLLDNTPALTLPKSLLQGITIPIQFGLFKTSQGVGKQFEFVILARTAAQENKAMSERMAQVLSENANLRRELAEARGFLDQQKSLDPLTYNQVPARPISFSRYLTIDKGSMDGIKVGMPVVVKDTYLGQIREVSPKQSSLILPSDPDSKLAAFVTNKNGKARGVLQGQFGSEMLLDKILHEEPVSRGDLVYSEGTEGNLPRGLVLGQVSEVSERQNQIFKQAKVKPVFNISDLDIVFVITN